MVRGTENSIGILYKSALWTKMACLSKAQRNWQNLLTVPTVFYSSHSQQGHYVIYTNLIWPLFLPYCVYGHGQEMIVSGCPKVKSPTK